LPRPTEPPGVSGSDTDFMSKWRSREVGREDGILEKRCAKDLTRASSCDRMVEMGISEMEAGEWGLRGWNRVRCKPELLKLLLAELNELEISSLHDFCIKKKYEESKKVILFEFYYKLQKN
jgi:hypothetical protein